MIIYLWNVLCIYIVADEDTSRGSVWHTGPIVDEQELGVWEQPDEGVDIEENDDEAVNDSRHDNDNDE